MLEYQVSAKPQYLMITVSSFVEIDVLGEGVVVSLAPNALLSAGAKDIELAASAVLEKEYK